MKIAVCIKQVPDSWAEKKMAGGVLDRANVDAVLNDLDECIRACKGGITN